MDCWTLRTPHGEGAFAATARPANFARLLKQLLGRANKFRFSEIVSSPEIKNISLPISVNQNYKPYRLIPEEGRWPSPPNVGMGCGGRGRRQAYFRAGRNAVRVRRSRVVLAPRCWRQALWRNPRGDGDNKPVHRGERVISRKAIAQGMSECFRCPVCSCAPLFAQFAHETAGAACTRHSLLPLFLRRDNEIASLGRNAPRECERMTGGRLHPVSPRIPSNSLISRHFSSPIPHRGKQNRFR